MLVYRWRPQGISAALKLTRITTKTLNLQSKGKCHVIKRKEEKDTTGVDQGHEGY
jgi:hypothetical protein